MGNTMRGAYESYMRGLSEPERRQLLSDLEKQRDGCGDAAAVLRISLLIDQLREIWTEGNALDNFTE